MVKIYTVSTDPAYYSPWLMDRPSNLTGSGCVIAGKRILTNAHVVSNHNYIQVQSYGQSRLFNARISYISHESDLALLTVDDETFYSDIRAVELGELPETLDEVLVYGFPTGGDSLSMTKGVLSRIEYQEYAHSNHYFLAGQIDAAINPGNSGGPVIVDNKIVGVAMQKNTSENVDNIGYFIPVPIVRHFLVDIKDGRYDGFPETGFIAQNMENPGLKEKYGMTREQTGILVNHVYWNASAQGKIKAGDVVLSIDGHRIADNGTIEFRPKELVSYTYYADMHQIGNDIHLEILRNGEIRNITYPLLQTGQDTSLVTSKEYDVAPRYFIYAGIVFSPLSENLLCAWKECDAPDNLNVMKDKIPTRNRQEVVVAVQVLPADINKGYHDSRPWIVRNVNGQDFRDFTEFHNIVMSSQEQFIVFKDDADNHIVIDRKKAEDSHKRVLQAYNIENDSSPDMKRHQADDYRISSYRQ